MRILIAPDSFKESATAVEVAEAMALGLRRALPEVELDLAPMADGGEGTVAALVAATRGRLVASQVTGPMGEPVSAAWGVLGDGRTAVIEMAAASGLALVPAKQRDPRVATTYGTGELMRAALDLGLRRIIVGLGGSATNDGGAGMAQALGVALRDADGCELPRGGTALARLAHIDPSGVHPALADCEVLVATDVTNRLCGTEGASRVYGPQKGADIALVEELDAALRHYGNVIEQQLGIGVHDLPGGGAAGGLGAGLAAFAHATLRPGVALVAEVCGLRERIARADWVLTGEGCLDSQSVYGKTPVGVARLAKEAGVPVVVLAGILGKGFDKVYAEGIAAAFAIYSGPTSIREAMQDAVRLIADRAEAIGRLMAEVVRKPKNDGA